MTDHPVWMRVVASGLVTLAIWVPLQMQTIVLPHNEGCFGPFSSADYRELLRIRLQTWTVSLVVTGLALLVIARHYRIRSVSIALFGLFCLWKTAALYFDINGSPICWEPYANDTPFWVEPVGTGLAFVIQPLSFVALSGLLIGLVAQDWFRFAFTIHKNRPERRN